MEEKSVTQKQLYKCKYDNENMSTIKICCFGKWQLMFLVGSFSGGYWVCAHSIWGSSQEPILLAAHSLFSVHNWDWNLEPSGS